MYRKKINLIFLLLILSGSFIQILNNSICIRNEEELVSIKFNAINYNNSTIISHDLLGMDSKNPSIAIDEEGGLHIVWEESGIWYANYNGSEWSEATKVSQSSYFWTHLMYVPTSIIVDKNGIIHIAWQEDFSYKIEGINAYIIVSEILYCSNNGTGWSDNIIISNNFNGNSFYPSMAVDSNGKAHIVWYDYSRGPWNSDSVIVYASNNGSGWTIPYVISDYDYGLSSSLNRHPDIFIDNEDMIHIVWAKENAYEDDFDIIYIFGDGYGWSNEILISDDSRNWNNGNSLRPSITGDKNGRIYVVWEDNTNGPWGTDYEIMFSYTEPPIYQWTKPIVISDDKRKWNDGSSVCPSITIDNSGKLHVVWEDYTNGIWGIDSDILYSSYDGVEWSKITIISDNNTNWNNGNSILPFIAIDINDKIHIVWEDNTDGIWGSDREIFYSSTEGYLLEINSSSENIPFGNHLLFLLIIGISIIFILLRKKYEISIKR